MEFVRRMRKSKPVAADQTDDEADAEAALTAPVEPETFSEAAMDEGFVREQHGPADAADDDRHGRGPRPPHDPESTRTSTRSTPER